MGVGRPLEPWVYHHIPSITFTHTHTVISYFYKAIKHTRSKVRRSCWDRLFSCFFQCTLQGVYWAATYRSAHAITTDL